MSLALKWVLSPLLIVQAMATGRGARPGGRRGDPRNGRALLRRGAIKASHAGKAGTEDLGFSSHLRLGGAGLAGILVFTASLR